MRSTQCPDVAKTTRPSSNLPLRQSVIHYLTTNASALFYAPWNAVRARIHDEPNHLLVRHLHLSTHSTCPYPIVTIITHGPSRYTKRPTLSPYSIYLPSSMPDPVPLGCSPSFAGRFFLRRDMGTHSRAGPGSQNIGRCPFVSSAAARDNTTAPANGPGEDSENRIAGRPYTNRRNRIGIRWEKPTHEAKRCAIHHGAFTVRNDYLSVYSLFGTSRKPKHETQSCLS